MLDPGGLATMKNESQPKAKGRRVIERGDVSENKCCTLALCKLFAEATSQLKGGHGGGGGGGFGCCCSGCSAPNESVRAS